MSYAAAIAAIESRLTGAIEHDRIELMRAAVEFLDDEDGPAVGRECGRRLQAMMSDADWEAARNSGTENVVLVFRRVNELIAAGDMAAADELSGALITKLEALAMFEDDEACEYRSFDEVFEEVLYRNKLLAKGKELRHAHLPYCQAYQQAAYVKASRGEQGDANVCLEKALRYNPVSCSARIEQLECEKAFHDLEAFYRGTLECFQYAFSSAVLARLYRNVGWYLAAKGDLHAAATLYLLSLQWEENEIARGELSEIVERAPEGWKLPSFDDVEKYAKQYGFPEGPDELVLAIAWQCGHECQATGRAEGARYFYGIFHDLTDDEETELILESLGGAGGA
ncbi:MAG: hypothetical protein HUK26_09655 [Duodenibacillus sp.]|nr:hypothetical protein [Duodenibacillus sp.]